MGSSDQGYETSWVSGELVTTTTGLATGRRVSRRDSKQFGKRSQATGWLGFVVTALLRPAAVVVSGETVDGAEGRSGKQRPLEIRGDGIGEICHDRDY